MLRWLRGKLGSGRAGGSATDADAILAELHALAGDETRAAVLPGWALLFRSPFANERPVTSWIGGAPVAHVGFVWPTGTDGRPLTFLAQFDLGDLTPHEETGARPPGLPDSGALLVFVGALDFATRILTTGELAEASPIPPPPELPPLSTIGFFGDQTMFREMAVDAIPFMSSGEDWPAELSKPFVQPEDWITNWGIARREASMMLAALEGELRLSGEFVDRQRQDDAEPSAATATRLAHCEVLLDSGPQLATALRDWIDRASTQVDTDEVDVAALRELVARRRELYSRLEQNFGCRHLLDPKASLLWNELSSQHPEIERDLEVNQVPEAFRGFVEARITGWRGHRLFGIEPEFPNNWEDRRGQDPLLSIAYDALLGTQSEHDYGFSIWLDRERMERGDHSSGQLIRHCAV